MPPVISLLHATRERPVEVVNCVDLWRSRWSGIHQYEHILSLDADCLLEDTPVRKNTIEAVAALRSAGKISAIFGCPCRSVAAWNRAYAKSAGAIVVQLSDDFSPPQDWDKLIVDHFGGLHCLHYPQLLGVIAPHGVGPYSGDGLQTIAIMTRALAQHLGYFLYPEFPSVSSDNEITQAAAIRGMLTMAPNVRFEHNWKGEYADPTYAKQNDSSAVYYGTRIYGDRMACLYASIDYSGEDVVIARVGDAAAQAAFIESLKTCVDPTIPYGIKFNIWAQRRLRGFGKLRNLLFDPASAMASAFAGDWAEAKARMIPLVKKYQNAQMDQGHFFFHGGLYLYNLCVTRLGGSQSEWLTRGSSL